MNGLLQIFIVGCAVIFSAIVIRLLLKSKISERQSVIWLGGTILILIISGNPFVLDITAMRLGVDYPPTLLFLLSTLVLLLFSLYQTIQITNLTKKIKDISQYLALEDYDNAESVSTTIDKQGSNEDER